jgi:hypothetical protein
MWSLPQMDKINRIAKSAAHKKAIRKALKNKKAVCDYHSEQCNGDVHVQPYYDIFSEDEKGVVSICSYHENLYGSPPEDFFECCSCSKTYQSFITWERYDVHDEDGNVYCINCYRDKFLRDSSNFISLLDDDSIERFSFEDVKRAPHLLAVQQPCPTNLKCHASVLFDSGSGETVTSSCSTSPQINGVNELKDALRQMKAEGEEKAVLIMDQAWQFCCQVSLYSLNREQLRKAA